MVQKMDFGLGAASIMSSTGFELLEISGSIPVSSGRNIGT